MTLAEVFGRIAGDMAVPAIHRIASMFVERGRISVTDLPADLLRPHIGELLFYCQVPTVGDKAQLSVPRVLGRAAIDAASRLAESLKRSLPLNEGG